MILWSIQVLAKFILDNMQSQILYGFGLYPLLQNVTKNIFIWNKAESFFFQGATVTNYSFNPIPAGKCI